MKINNENENIYYISCFHTKVHEILYIKSSRIPGMENNVNITYQVMGRQHITQNMIHENSSRKYIQTYLIISLYKCESNRI